MASLHTGFRNQNVELLHIETNLFDLYIQGKPYHPTVEALALHRDQAQELVEATLDVAKGPASVDILSIRVYSFLHSELVEIGEDRLYPCFYENQNYQLVILRKVNTHLEFYHDSILVRQAVKPLGKDILSGVLNFQNEVGFTDFEIKVDGQVALTIRLEIFPSKIDYKTDYQAILADVNEQIYNLSFDFLRKTYNLTGLRETQHQSLTELFSILQHIFRQLVDSVNRILHAPHTQLLKEHRVVAADKVKKSGKKNILYLAKRPYLLKKDEMQGIIHVIGQKYTPTLLIEERKILDFNTQENRFVRWMLERIIGKLKIIKRHLEEKERTNDPLLMQRIDHMQNQINRLLKFDFLNEVTPIRHISISLVLQMAPGYRDIYRFYLMLMKGLSIQGDLFHLSLKDLAQLYEYWCFLKIHSLLKEKYELVKQDIIRVHQNGLFVTLDKSQKASVTYRNPRTKEEFTLFYNTLPADTDEMVPTLAQKPDNILTLKKRDSKVEYRYIFDAKYRINPAYEGTTYFTKYEGLPGPEEEDINTMHRYRDAIVYQNPESGEFERGMFGAYVLFPYADEEKYKNHRFYKSIKKVNVGAFPFIPNSTELMQQFLDELILDSPEKAYDRATKPRGTTRHFQEKLSGKNVLIGSLADKEQLRICLEHNSYYIPLRILVNEQQILTQLEYIGLYQSKRFFTEQSGVHWTGRIEKWVVLRRDEIKERPVRRNNGSELYVRFIIEEWQKRYLPIVPGGHGIYTHLFTTKYMLDRAQEIAELRLDNEEQLKEWREKRRVGKVKVKLDHEYVDQANRVLSVEVEN